jgi:two-component system response regulator HydG
MASQTESKHILVVDDDRLIASLLEAGLQEAEREYVVTTVYSAKAALTKIQQKKFALMLTDYNMPDVNGVELMQQIRLLSPETRIILMSAHPSEVIEEMIGEIHADGYLEKPILLNKLWVLVEGLIG